MKDKSGIRSRIIKALASFTTSYAFVIMIYILISAAGVFDPINNKMAFQLLCICFVIAVFHFWIGFLDMKPGIRLYLLYFGAETAVVLFMGFVIFDFFKMSLTFFLCLAAMLVAAFAGTYLITFYDDWKKVQEINEMIRQSKR